MTCDNSSIDLIVAEVVRRLRQMTAEVAVGQTNQKTQAPFSGPPEVKSSRGSSSGSSQNSRDLVLDTPLVTLASVDGKLEGIRRVLVGSRTVVTPAVRDEIRKRRIQLEKGEIADQDDKEPAALWLGQCTKKPNIEQRASSLIKSLGMTTLTFTDLNDAVGQIAASVGNENRVALLLTDQPLAAACLANRFLAVRAAVGNSVESAGDAVRAIGANVLIVDPLAVTSFVWKQMVRVFGSSESRSCPEILRGHVV